MICSNCGRNIKVGERYFKIPGLIYRCCSKACLLECYVPTYQAGINTGDEED